MENDTRCTTIQNCWNFHHYSDVILSAKASQIIRVSLVYSTVCSGADEKKRHQSSTSLAFLRRIHRGLVNSPNKGPVTRKMFLFDDVIMESLTYKLDSSLRRYFTQANDFLWDVKVKLTSSVTFKWYHFDSCSRNAKAKGYHADCLSSSAGSQVVT